MKLEFPFQTHAPNNLIAKLTQTHRSALRTIILISVGALCATVLSLAALFLYLDPQVPKAETYRNVQLETPLKVYTEDGALLAEFGERRLIPITLEQVPEHFINALLDTEDKRFYAHTGIDFISLANDMVGLVGTFITEGELGGGASTITMQVARNVSFTLERRFLRKFKEMLLALKIERELNKDEILSLYINLVAFGKRAYGAEAAARTYYGKSLDQLTLPQLAMLAGIPQAPSAGNPINGPSRALQRRNLVLSRMRAQNSISDAMYKEAISAPISASIYSRELDIAGPYPAEWARQLAIDSYPDLYTGGYEIFTTLHSAAQASAISALRKGLLNYDRRHGYRGVEASLPAEILHQIEEVAAPISNKTADDSSAASPTIIEAVIPAVIPAINPAVIEAITSELENYPVYGSLTVAAVVDLTEDAATVVNQPGEFITLSFTDAAWARPYIDANLRGPPPTQFSDYLQIGDVVRIHFREERWRLAQLPEIQGAIIAMDPQNGKVRAIVGGFDFYQNQYNHALQAARQPGSGFKPFVYSAALATGITPADIFMDAPLVFDDANLESQYRPDNDNNSYNGPTRLREALYRSINLVSMRVLLKVGAGRVLEHAADLGFATNKFPRNTQLAIGGGTMAVTPSDMARAYGILANGGYLVEPHVLDFIRDRNGQEIYRANHPIVCAKCLDELAKAVGPGEESAVGSADGSVEGLAKGLAERLAEEPTSLDQLLSDNSYLNSNLTDESTLDPLESPATQPDSIANNNEHIDQVSEEIYTPPPPIYAPRVLDERNVFLMNTMLRDAIQKGTGRRARSLGRKDIAGKTGTTNEAADTWFNGYHPNLVATVWVGFSNHAPLGNTVYGSNTPLPIWIDFMRDVLPKLPEVSLSQPAGVISLKIDPTTGKLAAPGQRDAIFEYFLSEHVPAERHIEEPPQLDQKDDINAIDFF